MKVRFRGIGTIDVVCARESTRRGVRPPPPPPSLSEPNRGVKPAGSTPPVLGAAPNLTTTACSPTPKTPMDRCTLLRATLERSVPTAHDMLTIVTYVNISCRPPSHILTHARRVSASPLSTGPPPDRSALHHHRHTVATVPAQQHCDSFRFRRAAFHNGLKSKVGLAASAVRPRRRRCAGIHMRQRSLAAVQKKKIPPGQPCVHMCTCLCICKCLRTCICLCTQCLCICKCMYMYMYMYMYVYVYKTRLWRQCDYPQSPPGWDQSSMTGVDSSRC